MQRSCYMSCNDVMWRSIYIEEPSSGFYFILYFVWNRSFMDDFTYLLHINSLICQYMLTDTDWISSASKRDDLLVWFVIFMHLCIMYKFLPFLGFVRLFHYY